MADLSLHITHIYRYAKESSPAAPDLGGYPNYHHYTASGSRPKLLLESGINLPAPVAGPDGPRRPLIGLRSSPWKAGQNTNPWHDEFDLDHGHVRFYGDHRPGTVGLPGATTGNRGILQAWRLHGAADTADRAAAPPLLLWRAVPVHRAKKRVVKGHVEFCGVAVIERLEYVVQRDPTTGRSFPNIVLDLAVLQLVSDELDMRFVTDRRDPALSASQALQHAPDSWKRWVRDGRAALPRQRRRVLSSRVLNTAQQQPDNGPDKALLTALHTFFDDRKHAFELLASNVAASVLTQAGGRYREGWITRAGGDGGMDFVGRLDVGTPDNNTPMVILGQAKCVKPTTSISPDEVARLVARLRRGWLGVFVTTGSFSRQAQVEIIDDQYPVILVAGKALVLHVRRLADTQTAGDLNKLLLQIATEYEQNVVYRRPEEVLQA